MNLSIRTALVLFTLSIALAGCGGGSDSQPEAPLNTDYSKLKIAASREGALVYAKSADALLNPLRNGVRLSLNSGPPVTIAGLTAPNIASQAPYSATTVQVEGVDEADPVKYDGRYIYSVFPEVVPAKPGMTRNVLKIAKTNPADATLEVTTEFQIPGEQSTLPVIYQQQDAAGAAQYIAAVSQNFGGWLSPQPQATALVVLPDRTRVQLLDVRDPFNVSQAWEIELDGWLRGTRKIGNTLYLVNSYRPRLPGLVLPADTQEKKQANERRIRNATAQELMPTVRVNGATARQLATTGDCVIAADLTSEEAYTDLLVITTLDLDARTIRGVECTSTNMNGLYMSHDSLYIGGQGLPGTLLAHFTALHKFALEPTGVSYRATGVVGGHLPWGTASYFMDEHEGRLRIVTTENPGSGQPLHRLTVFHELPDQRLMRTSQLPHPGRPELIGKPGDQLTGVRFMGDRAYVVTARMIDPLYVIDLTDPADPYIAGELEVPGLATYLQPLTAENTDLLLSVGRQTNNTGVAQGLKVELFDVSDITQPRSLGAHVFGSGESWSEALGTSHAMTLLTIPGEQVSHRIGLPINVYESEGGTQRWTYSGFHFLEVSSVGGSPQLHVQGVLKTEESSGPGSLPSYVVPRRVVMHGDAAYGVNGGTYTSSLWDFISSN